MNIRAVQRGGAHRRIPYYDDVRCLQYAHCIATRRHRCNELRLRRHKTQKEQQKSRNIIGKTGTFLVFHDLLQMATIGSARETRAEWDNVRQTEPTGSTIPSASFYDSYRY